MCRATRESAVLLPLDIATAFPTIQRAAVLPVVYDDHDVFKSLHMLGFSQEQITEITSEADALLEWGTTSEHMRVLVSTLASCPWMAFDNRPGVITPQRGVLAGVSWVDGVFCLAESKVSREVETALMC